MRQLNFDNLNQLMEHTRIHTENTYECDECNWRFTLISELTIHGREFHDTREQRLLLVHEILSNTRTIVATQK